MQTTTFLTYVHHTTVVRQLLKFPVTLIIDLNAADLYSYRGHFLTGADFRYDLQDK